MTPGAREAYPAPIRITALSQAPSHARANGTPLAAAVLLSGGVVAGAAVALRRSRGRAPRQS
jgi:hypothetical protein